MAVLDSESDSCIKHAWEGESERTMSREIFVSETNVCECVFMGVHQDWESRHYSSVLHVILNFIITIEYYLSFYIFVFWMLWYRAEIHRSFWVIDTPMWPAWRCGEELHREPRGTTGTQSKPSRRYELRNRNPRDNEAPTLPTSPLSTSYASPAT